MTEWLIDVLQYMGVLIGLLFVVAGIVGLINPRLLAYKQRYWARWQVFLLSFLGFFLGAGISAIPAETPDQQSDSLILWIILLIAFVLVGLKRKPLPFLDENLVAPHLSKNIWWECVKKRFSIAWQRFHQSIKEEEKRQELRRLLLKYLKQFIKSDYQDETLLRTLKNFDWQGIALLSSREKAKYAETAYHAIMTDPVYSGDSFYRPQVKRFETLLEALRVTHNDSSLCFKALSDFERNYKLKNLRLSSIFGLSSFVKNKNEEVFFEVSAQWLGKEVSYYLKGSTMSGIGSITADSGFGIGVGYGLTQGKLKAQEEEIVRTHGDLVITNQRLLLVAFDTSFSIPFSKLINYSVLSEQLVLNCTEVNEPIKLKLSTADAYAAKIVLERLCPMN